jgi:hypothetical protein
LARERPEHFPGCVKVRIQQGENASGCIDNSKLFH